MITRGDINHQYYPAPVGRINRTGYVRVNVINGVPQSWAIARPSTSPDPNGAPHYLTGDRNYGDVLQRGGQFALIPARPRVQMDPSDQSTWQRPYVFTS